jgi:hypothetical protein
LAAGHQGFSCTSLKVVAENLCPAANFVLGQASFVPLATTLSELSDHGKWNAKITHWVFNPKCGKLQFRNCTLKNVSKVQPHFACLWSWKFLSHGDSWSLKCQTAWVHSAWRLKGDRTKKAK